MKKIAYLILPLLLVAGPASAKTWNEYRIVLKDGSWLSAQGEPELQDDEAHLRLPSGLKAVEQMDVIDWQKTRAWNFQAVYLRDVISGPVAVEPLSGENPYGNRILNVPEEEISGEAALALVSKLAPPPDPTSQMRQRVLELAEEMGALKERRSVLERAAATSRDPRRANELRREAGKLEQEIRKLRSDQARLILKLPRPSY